MLVLAFALSAVGCGSDLLFVGDPVLRATLPDPEEFERDVRAAGRDGSMRTEVYWPSDPPATIALAPILREREIPTVALAPYLSLLAADVAPTFPDRHFIGFYGSEPLANVTWVHFDAIPAMTDAGAALARWVFAGGGRAAVLVVDETSGSTAEEAQALAAGYAREAGVELEREAFTTPPTRDGVRARVQALAAGDDRAVVVLLGPATAWALEFLRDERTLIGIRHAPLSDDPARLLFTVRDDLVDGISSALAARGERVSVPSILELSPIHFPSGRRR